MILSALPLLACQGAITGPQGTPAESKLWAAEAAADTVKVPPAPPMGCSDLEEAACWKDPACIAIYAPPCSATANADVASCDYDAAPVFVSCEDKPKGCAKYTDEKSCSADPACKPLYNDPCVGGGPGGSCPMFATCVEGGIKDALDKAGAPAAEVVAPAADEPKADGVVSGDVARTTSALRTGGTVRNLRTLTINLWWGNNSKYVALSNMLLQKVSQGTAPDVVFVEEAFYDEGSLSAPYPVFRQMLGQAYPYQAHGPMRTGARLFGSGLLILSRMPYVGTADMVYDNCFGWDCFARKGAAMAMVNLGPDCGNVALFNTHTQAGKKGDFLWFDPAVARLGQMGEYAWFVRRFTGADNSVPVIAGGDFNFFARPNDATDWVSYRIMTQSLAMSDAEPWCTANRTECAAPHGSGNGLGGDPVKNFMRGNTARKIKITPATLDMHPTADWGNLSDHVVIESNWRLACGDVPALQN